MLPLKVQTIESRVVAEMMGKDHSNLLKDISRYQQYISQVKINFADFFIESVYLDTQDKERKCYQITKKGCEFLAHKMTREKGAVFTAAYINKFHEMEQELTGNRTVKRVAKEKLSSINNAARTILPVMKNIYITPLTTCSIVV